MSNIFSGSATEEEIKSFIGGRPLVSIYAKDKDNPNVDGDYPFWSSIRHPETGKLLRAVKGYCEPTKTSYLGDRLCYYAEYKDEVGNPYYYLDSRYFCKSEFRGSQSIAEQQFEDKQELKQKFANSDEEFLSKHQKRESSEPVADEQFFGRAHHVDRSSPPEEHVIDKTDSVDGDRGNADEIVGGGKHSQGVSN